MADIKLKLLRIMDIMKKTDEDHPVTAGQIVKELSAYGITAERKSVGRDLNALKEAGYDILLSKNARLGYYMGEHEFEDWELKVLGDAVWSAKFLTNNTARELSRKLYQLSSEAGEKNLRQLSLSYNPLKSHYPTTRINISVLMDAIRKKHMVCFQYTYTDTDMKKKERWNGKLYRFSPYKLVWHGDFYYAVGNKDGYDNLSFYRLDRIANVCILDDACRPIKDVAGTNAAEALEEFITSSIYSYNGKKIHLGIEFSPEHLDDIIDYFGSELSIKMIGDQCQTRVEVIDSDGLYFWLLQYSQTVRVVEPEEVKNKLKEKAENIIKMYT